MKRNVMAAVVISSAVGMVASVCRREATAHNGIEIP